MSEETNQATEINEAQQAALEKGLKIEEIKIGEGPAAEAGQFIRAHYTGILSNGDEFDSSHNRGEPLEFQLGVGQVIEGWDVGMQGLKVGGKRKLTIPPEMGYGSRDMGVIPPNSTLIFDVELVEILNF